MSNIVTCYVPVALNITLTVEKRGFGDTKSWKKKTQIWTELKKMTFAFEDNQSKGIYNKFTDSSNALFFVEKV